MGSGFPTPWAEHSTLASHIARQACKAVKRHFSSLNFSPQFGQKSLASLQSCFGHGRPELFFLVHWGCFARFSKAGRAMRSSSPAGTSGIASFLQIRRIEGVDDVVCQRSVKKEKEAAMVSSTSLPLRYHRYRGTSCGALSGMLPLSTKRKTSGGWPWCGT
jgi:hypothetical protein